MGPPFCVVDLRELLTLVQPPILVNRFLLDLHQAGDSFQDDDDGYGQQSTVAEIVFAPVGEPKKDDNRIARHYRSVEDNLAAPSREGGIIVV